MHIDHGNNSPPSRRESLSRSEHRGLVAQSVTADRSAPSLFRGVVLRRELFERLSAAGRVTEVSAPPGSGKTYLLRSGISDAGLANRAAWVSVGRDERDPGRFWLSVLNALRGTRVGSTRVRAATPAPDPDTWAIVEGLGLDPNPRKNTVAAAARAGSPKRL